MSEFPVKLDSARLALFRPALLVRVKPPATGRAYPRRPLGARNAPPS